MPDVRIDFDVLETTRRTLADIGDVLTSATDAVSDIPSAAVAQSDLRDRLHEMGDVWGSSLRKLSTFATEAGAGLEGVVDAFRSLDEQIADSLKEEG